MKLYKSKRRWIVGNLKNIEIQEKCKIKLKSNEQITFTNLKKNENEICKKGWGYYLTPSINRRLKNYNHQVFVITNKKKDKYIVIVKNSKMKSFKKYCENENLKYIKI